MTRLEKIGIIFIALGLCWMIGKTIYGVGYRDGIMKANNEIIIEYEQKIDELTDACNDKVEAAKQEILEMF